MRSVRGNMACDGIGFDGEYWNQCLLKCCQKIRYNIDTFYMNKCLIFYYLVVQPSCGKSALHLHSIYEVNGKLTVFSSYSFLNMLYNYDTAKLQRQYFRKKPAIYSDYKTNPNVSLSCTFQESSVSYSVENMLL